jgi:hypothetical protein
MLFDTGNFAKQCHSATHVAEAVYSRIPICSHSSNCILISGRESCDMVH